MPGNLANLIESALAEGFRLPAEEWDTLLDELRAHDISRHSLGERLERALNRWQLENRTELQLLERQFLGLKLLGLVSINASESESTNASTDSPSKRRRLNETGDIIDQVVTVHRPAKVSNANEINAPTSISKNEAAFTDEWRSVSPSDSESDDDRSDDKNPSLSTPATSSDTNIRKLGDHQVRLMEETSRPERNHQDSGVKRISARESLVDRVVKLETQMEQHAQEIKFIRCRSQTMQSRSEPQTPLFCPDRETGSGPASKKKSNVRKVKQEPRTPSKAPSGRIEVIELDD